MLTKAHVSALLELVPSHSDLSDAVRLLRESLVLCERVVTSVSGGLTLHRVANAFSEVEKHDRRVCRVWMRHEAYQHLASVTDPALIEHVIQRDALLAGLRGYAWGAEFRVSPNIPTGCLVVIPEYTEYDDMAPDARDADLRPGWTPSREQIFRY